MEFRTFLFAVLACAMAHPGFDSSSRLLQAFQIGAGYAGAQTNAFYESKTVRIITFDPVGGYNFLGRLLTPPDRVMLLRQAYAKALRDPELLAEAQKAQWELAPVLGEDVQELARRVVEQPPAVIEQFKRILRSN